jgi:hypothetical protein
LLKIRLKTKKYTLFVELPVVQILAVILVWVNR